MSALLPGFLDVTVSLATLNLSFTKVRRYTLTDALNTIPELVVEVLCDDPALDLTSLVGETALALLNDEPRLPCFDGIVRAVELQSVEPSGVSCYALTIAPPLWLTTERSAHRIFRQQTTFGIIGRIFAKYGPRIPDLEAALSRPVEDWKEYDYRVQYGETDRDFVFRLLSEEGLVSYWLPSADDPQKLVWTLTDDTSVGAHAVEVPFRAPGSALTAAGPHVQAVTMKARLAPSEVKLRDYDYEKPAFLLERRSIAAGGVSAEDPLGHYSYEVGRFTDEAGGDLLSQIRLEEARAKSRIHRWEMSFAALAGTTIRLHDHPREDTNGDFLIVSMRADVEPNRRRHAAELVPAASPWRPELRQKPKIHGTQTAFVVGAPGREIDVDNQGRVEVELRWDTRDLHTRGASRRVRVATPWAGQNRGFWTVPRVGDEVVIAYLDGDPDQPMVVGSVNNAVAPPAINPAKHATQSWWKSKVTPNGGPLDFNAIFMDDAQGNELLAFHAHRDLVTEVGHDMTTRVEGASSASIVKGLATEVGGDVKTTVKGKCELQAGQVEIHSKGDINVNANGARNDSAETFHYTSAPFVYVVGRNEIQITAQDSIKLVVGSASITIVDGKITLSAPLVEINP